MTESDERLRRTDLPERLMLRRVPLRPEGDFDTEAKWVVDDAFAARKDAEPALATRVAAVLALVHRDSLEVRGVVVAFVLLLQWILVGGESCN